jgi:hypothetical protein
MIKKEGELWDWNANHIDFDFNQEGKFYLLCEKDNKSFKIIFANFEPNPYILNPKEIYGDVIIGEYTKEFIKSFIEYGTNLGDVFKYDLFIELEKNELIAKEKVLKLLPKLGFKNYLDKKNIFHKNFRKWYYFSEGEQGYNYSPFRKSVKKIIKSKNSEERFNPICFTQLLNELEEQDGI